MSKDHQLRIYNGIRRSKRRKSKGQKKKTPPDNIAQVATTDGREKELKNSPPPYSLKTK